MTVVMPPAAAALVPVVKSSRSVWPGILEVRVRVDRAGQDHQPGGVDHLVGAAAVGAAADRGDAAVLDQDVGREDAVVGGERAAGDDRALAAHGGEVLCRAMAGTEPSKAIVSSLWIRRLRAQRLRDTRFVLMSSSARRSLLGVEGVRESGPCPKHTSRTQAPGSHPPARAGSS